MNDCGRREFTFWLQGVVAVAALLLVQALQAQTVTGTVPVGGGPCAVAMNPVTNKIYVANSNGNNVTVIDGAT